MVGEFEDNNLKGIIPRAFDYIFEKIKTSQQGDKSSKYSVSIAFIQIYLETIQDLFEPSNQVRIREDPDTGVYLENTMWIKVNSTAQCAAAFKRGEKNRVTECTRMNAHSSRSHALLIAKIEKNFSDSESNEHVMTKSNLYLVDLAGSERVAKTKAKEMRLEEAKKINYSLLVLGNCIQSLTDSKSTHVSYRDSKLTRILQESLGGNAKTSLIVTVSPSTYNAEETISSLNFGLRAMKVQNKPVINKTEDYQAQCFKLQEDYDKLMDQYSKLKIDYDNVVEENNKLKNSEVYLDLQRQSLKAKLGEGGGVPGVKGKGSSGGKTIKEADHQSEIDDLKNKFSEEIKKMEKFYEDVIKNKDEEHDKILKEVDDTLVKKENEIDLLKANNSELTYKFQTISDSVNDITKENEDLKKSMNDMLIEKENYQYKIQQLTAENDKFKSNVDSLKKKISEDEIKRGKVKTSSSQTESLIDQKTKELLLNMKISLNDIIMNRYDKIMNQLLVTIDTINSDSSVNSVKVKKLNESIEALQKSYEDKLKEANDKISSMTEEISILNEEKSKNDQSKNDIKAQYEKEIESLKKQLKDMEGNQSLTKKELLEFQNQKKAFEKKMYDITNDNKILSVNAQSANADYKQLQNAFSFNEKTLNRNLSSFINDLVVFNQYKKELKKIDNIFESDLPNASTSKGMEFFSNKIRNQLSKVQSMLEDIANNGTTSSSSPQNQSLEMKEAIEKLSETMNDNKNVMFTIMTLYTKLSKIFYDNVKMNSKYKTLPEQNSEITSLETNVKQKSEIYMKNGLLYIIKQNLEKFSPLCYTKNVDDLMQKLNVLSAQVDKLSAQDILKGSSSLFEELILRISSYKDEKELEIENLNEKIIYLLRELDIYRKNAEGVKGGKSPGKTRESNDTLINQLNLKNEEINRLNKAIEANLTRIKTLSCENALLKSKGLNPSTKTSTASSVMSQSPSSQDLEFRINQYKNEINQINDKLAQLKDQQITENMDKEIKHKNDYFKERLKKNIKKNK